MIRINLLPFRAARAKENIRRQVSVFLLLLILVSLSMTYATIMIDREIKTLESEISQINIQIKTYKAKADEVSAIEKELVILDQKLNAITALESMRKEPVILLEAMTRLIVPEQMWITSLQTSNTSVTLKGVAFDNKTVADFMTNLEKSPIFQNIDLQTLQMQEIQDVKVKTFEILASKANNNNKQDNQSKKK